MMLAFLVDQVQEAFCPIFQHAVLKATSKIRLWEKLRILFFGYFIESWESFYQNIILGFEGGKLTPNTS
jgi:uncharacterized protein YhhL (DUF1145 family)